MKHTTFVWVGLILLLFVLSSSARSEEKTPVEYSVSTLSPMVKLRPDQSPKETGNKTIRLYAARGEGESAQIVIKAGELLKDIKVTASHLTNPVVDFKIAPELHRVGYVPVKNPTPGGFGEPGLYPDPLFPFQPFEIQPGQSQSIWVTVWVPRETPPGDYQGPIIITPANGPATIVTLQVHVYEVTLPVQSFLRTHCLIWNFGADPKWYGKTDWAPREQRMIENLLRYRLTSPPPLPWNTIFSKGEDGQWTAKWREFDQAVEEWMNKGSTFFRIGEVFPWYGQPPASITEREEKATKLRLLDAHLKEKGWNEVFGFYLFDEPVISPNYPNPGDTVGPENVKKIQAIARFIHENAPNLRLMYVTCDPAHEAVAMDIPVYTWVPHINHFHPEFQLKRKQMDEQNWMYVCLTTIYVPTFPDIWRIDWTGTAQRTIGWWLWRYQCDGFLYWCADYWTKDPYTTPDIFDNSNGDGFLFYPDPAKKADPFPSIRVELVRDGLEDYDLFTLLKNAVAKIKADPVRKQNTELLLSKAEKLLNLADVIPGTDQFSKDPAVYEIRHRQVLELLEQLER